MDWALVFSAVFMGLAGSSHCVVMCGASSSAVIGACRGRQRIFAGSAFHLGRLLSYSLAGALVSSSVGFLRDWGSGTAVLRPFWTLLHLAAFGLGLFLLWQGRQPGWLDRRFRLPSLGSELQAEGWQRIRGPSRALGIGSLWALWPCGLLQSALLVAALTNHVAGGALVMAGFALASSLGLGAAPLLLARFAGLWGGREHGVSKISVRLSGLVLAIASAWALIHGLWEQIAAYCAV